jgi:hypothetical protein
MRHPLEKEIAKRQAEVDDLTQQLAIATKVLAALKDVLRRLPVDGTLATPSSATSTPQPKTELRPGTDLAAARDAIIFAGKPLHVTDLLGILGKENTKPNRVSLTGSLGSYVRKGLIFSRPAPNVFGLIEMEGQPTQDSLPMAS